MAKPQTTTVFNCAFQGAVDSGLSCDICYTPMLKPVMLRCGHSGCHICVEELLESSTIQKCPVCRDVFSRSDVRPNVALAQVASELGVQCLASGCGWTGKYGNATSHYQSCPKVPIQCPNDGCVFRSLRESMTTHTASCPRRTLPCPNCLTVVKVESVGEHQRKWCEHAVTKCPLSCGIELPRSFINLHSHKCKGKAVTCQVPGCSTIVRRGEMRAHLMESANSHIKMQFEEIQRLRRTIREKTPENICIKTENVTSFSWKVEGFRDIQTRPLTSPPFNGHESSWRFLATKENNLLLQLMSSDPQSVQLRFLKMSREESNKKMVVLEEKTMREGEMWGFHMTDLDYWMENGNLAIKCIIYHLKL